MSKSTTEDWAATLDLLLDRMPAAQRKEALKRLDIGEDLQPHVHKSHRVAELLLLTVVFFIWTVPLTVLGLALCVTIIGIPPGIFLIGCGARPIATMVEKHVLRTM